MIPLLLRSGFIERQQSEDFAKQIVHDFDVRTAGIEHSASSLSGGTLQKFIMGREIMQTPRVLVAAQPTWGVDAGAASAIHRALIELAGSGAAILVISQDLDELMTISDRISVIANGNLTPPRGVETLSVEEIGLSMGGQAAGGVGHA